eukprot:TRINITY_DN19973_c0_g1_i1.p1 TRINITY_DN19973_c0_g1~~TRINITY_DN19973_c0_g1_i1.p1  ORF type:complete len:554 (-),score=125.66 TRINITY_DN19973_c0_g1_i1:250-1890(-)
MGDRTPCKFWVPQKRGGCKFGDRCKYPHPVPRDDKCRYFSGSSGCRDGDFCLFTHDKGGGKGGHAGKGGGGGGKHGKGKDPAKGGGRRTEVPEAVKEQLLESFRQLDTNHDGVIQREDINQVMKLLSPGWQDGDSDKLLQKMDINRDGKVQYEEFVSFCVASGDGWDKTRKFIQDSEKGDPLSVTVSDLAGHEYQLRGKSTWSVARLKLAIYHASDIPPEFQDLAAGGEDLRDQDVLGDSKVKGLTGGYYEFQLIDTHSAAGGVVAAEAVLVPAAGTPAAGDVVQYRWTEMAVNDMPPDFASSLGKVEAGCIVKDGQLQFLLKEGWPADHLVEAGLISKTILPAAAAVAAAPAGAAGGEEAVEYRWTAMATDDMPSDLSAGLGVLKAGDVVKDEHFKFLETLGWPTDHLVDTGLITKHMVPKAAAAAAASPAAAAAAGGGAKTEEVTEYKWTEMATSDMPPDFAAELGAVTAGDVATAAQLKFLESRGWPADHLADAGLLEKCVKTVSKPPAKSEAGGFVVDLEDTEPAKAPADKPKEEEFDMDLF